MSVVEAPKPNVHEIYRGLVDAAKNGDPLVVPCRSKRTLRGISELALTGEETAAQMLPLTTDAEVLTHLTAVRTVAVELKWFMEDPELAMTYALVASSASVTPTINLLEEAVPQYDIDGQLSFHARKA